MSIRERNIGALLLGLTLLCSCGTSGAGPGRGSADLSIPELRVLDRAGNPLPAQSARLEPVPGGYAVYAMDSRALGFCLSYSPQQHVAGIERGSYFSPDDLYLAVSNLAGRADIGGYHLQAASALPAEGALVARVLLAAGRATHTAAALPTGEGCIPLDFDYTDNLDSSATFSWRFANRGDYNQDGEVNISDLTPIGVNFGRNSSDNTWESAGLADGDGNGEVNIGDLTPIGQHYLTLISGYKLEYAGAQSGPYSTGKSLLLAEGNASPALAFSFRDPSPLNGSWYRVRAFSSADESAGASCEPLLLSLLPPGDPPLAAFAMDPATADTGMSIQFTDNSSGATSWIWNFGDGATSTARNPSHAYTAAGSFSVTLAAHNSYGSSNAQKSILISEAPVLPGPEKTFVAQSYATLSADGRAFTIHATDLPDGTDILFGPLTQGMQPVDNNLVLTWPYRGGLNEPAASHQNIRTAPGVLAMTVAGLVIYGPSNASTITRSSTVWTYDANKARINGEDNYGGHASPVNGGQYHYHDVAFITQNAWVGVPDFFGVYEQADGHSKLVGWAMDGYPIYGPYGYTDPLDSGSGVMKMTPGWVASSSGANRPPAVLASTAAASSNSAYITLGSDPGALGLNPGMRVTLINGAAPAEEIWLLNQQNVTYAGGGHPPYAGPPNSVQVSPNVTIPSGAGLRFEFLPGCFIEDNLFTGNGTLDRYNGRYCVTPDYPGGTYAYFLTMNEEGEGLYPYILGQELYGSSVVGGTPGSGYVKPQ